MVSIARQQAISQSGGAIPPSVVANLLVDTGASCTNIDDKIIQLLGLVPTGSVPVHTPSTGLTPVVQQVYDIGLVISAPPTVGLSMPYFVSNMPVTAADFSAQNIDGLLGRDILQACRMTYSGPQNMLMLSF